MNLPRWFRSVVTLAVATLAACGGEKRVAAPQATESAPAPNSPANAVRLVEWCWEHRDAGHYGALFPVDFRYQFLGEHWEPIVLTREEELAAARAIFTSGAGGLPPASSVTVDFDRNLVALPDGRVGKTADWHREIATRFNLTIDFHGETERAVGTIRFYLVRGDSASIPAELQAGADSSRWYVEGCEEEVPTPEASAPRGPSPMQALPTRALTWGQIKLRYLGR